MTKLDQLVQGVASEVCSSEFNVEKCCDMIFVGGAGSALCVAEVKYLYVFD